MGTVARKATKAETEFRTKEVYGLLLKAKTRQQIIQHASEKWGIGGRQADNYIEKARAMITEDVSISRPAWLAETLTRLRSYEQHAMDRNQVAVAIQAIQTAAKLIGHNS